jgi:hypothetical protein
MTIPRPLIQVDPANLIKGRPYLIENVIRDSTPHLRHLKGIFKKNTNFHNIYMSLFTDVIGPGNRPFPDHNLQSTYWKYYDAGAEKRILADRSLRQITGDPAFVYTPTPSRKPSASIHTVALDHPRMSWFKKAALEAAEHNALENRIDDAHAASGRDVIPRAQSSYKVGVNSKQGGKTMRNCRRRRGCRSLKNKNRRNYSKRRY